MTFSLLKNPHRGKGFIVEGAKPLSHDVSKPFELLSHCTKADPTPLNENEVLAKQLGIKKLYFKDERQRMGLGSFKALGASYVVAKTASQNVKGKDWANALTGYNFITASAGNHGLSLAAGARLFGAKATIVLSETVPKSFHAKLKSYDADVVIAGENYEESLEAAKSIANDNEWMLISDSTWQGYHIGVDIMEGYLITIAEVVVEMSEAPSHIFLQAGVGGLAGAIAAFARVKWGEEPIISVVEPNEALALQNSIAAGKVRVAKGGVSNMGRLDCKDPSHSALQSLSQTADYFIGLDDDYVLETIQKLNPYDLATSPSGGAGFAGLCAALQHGECAVNESSSVLIFISEGEADD